MTTAIPINTIELTPGSSITINNLTWQDFENIIHELGEKRGFRINYYQGQLEIMSPLAIHERPHRIIADIVKAILEIQGRDWEDFGSTTFKRPKLAGIEPDTCFYIQNASKMQGCTQMDLSIYPPPDLAIESDVTSVTTLEIYRVIAVPEVWIYRDQKLKIFVLIDGNYQETSVSSIFPDLQLTILIPNLVEKAINQGTSKMLRQLKQDFQKKYYLNKNPNLI